MSAAPDAAALALAHNHLSLSGRMVAREVLRYTPAGVPVLEFRCTHASQQLEAQHPRRVELELGCIALGRLAHALCAAELGAGLHLAGFLAARSVKNRAPVLHVTNIEFCEDSSHGIQTEI